MLASHGPEKVDLKNVVNLKMSQLSRNVKNLDVHGTLTTLPRNIFLLIELQELHLKNNTIC